MAEIQIAKELLTPNEQNDVVQMVFDNNAKQAAEFIQSLLDITFELAISIANTLYQERLGQIITCLSL